MMFQNVMLDLKKSKRALPLASSGSGSGPQNSSGNAPEDLFQFHLSSVLCSYSVIFSVSVKLSRGLFCS